MALLPKLPLCAPSDRAIANIASVILRNQESNIYSGRFTSPEAVYTDS